jgi:sorbitol-specific phosphotransferase system component IIC
MDKHVVDILTGMSFMAIWLLLILPCMIIAYRDLRRIWRVIARAARMELRRYVLRVWIEERKRGIA